jgi:acetyl-CoA C-acetyltransferase
MRDVAIVGVGMTPVGEHWSSSLRMLAADALRAAFEDSDTDSVEALYVGNAYGATFSSQSQLGALIADYAGLGGVEAYTIEAGDASGGAALRAGYLAVASGAVERAAVVGVEKATDSIGADRVDARSVSLDADYESVVGATLPALAALVMRRYMTEHNLDLSAFEGFSINAHANGKRNPCAMFRNTLKPGAFAKAAMISDPVSLFDGAPDADGAAAVILMPVEQALIEGLTRVRVVGSAAATDTLAIQDRQDLLRLRSLESAVQKALRQAGMSIDAIDFLEPHDSFTILTALSLEASGFASYGKGWKMATDQTIGLTGRLPLSTFGGLKSRGNPVGATGIYQAVEAVLQLRREAGDNQVANARVGMVQSVAGIGSTSIVHILSV